MYAIIESGGRQWRVEPGSRLDVNRLAGTVGSTHTVEQVLLAHDGQEATIGRPYVPGAKVVCEVLEHRLGPKEISYHFRRRENWRKTVGHRQPLSRLLVKDIVLPGAGQAAAATSQPKKAHAAPKADAAGPVTKTPRVTRKPPKLSIGKTKASR